MAQLVKDYIIQEKGVMDQKETVLMRAMDKVISDMINNNQDLSNIPVFLKESKFIS